MYPPLHEVCKADTSVQSLLGSGSALRIFPFGQARQKDVYPYVVWQIVGGTPENFLAERPKVDRFTTQVDVYASGWSSARQVANAIQGAIEGVAYVVNYHGEMRDPDTDSYRISFDVDWITPR